MVLLAVCAMVTQCTFWSYPQSLGDCQVLWLEWALVGQVSVVHLSDDPRGLEKLHLSLCTAAWFA